MYITIENFGPIDNCRFDTEKDLLLIFGKNGVGKSYAISLVYLILKNMLELNDSSRKYKLIYFFDREFNTDIKELEQRVEKSSDTKIDISHDVEQHIIFCLENLLVKSLNDSLTNTFNELTNLQNNFTEKPVQVTLEWHNSELGIDLTVVLGLKKTVAKGSEFGITECKFSKRFVLTKSKTCRKSKVTEEQVTLYFPLDKKAHFESSYVMLIAKFFSGLLDDELQNVYYLPASRSGLYQALGAFGQIFAELSKSRRFTSKRIDIPAISEPVADYFLHLSNINPSRKLRSDFTSYVDEIEKEILQGKVEFDGKSKKILFAPNDAALKLDLSTTSSMVSEISPVVSYLKYILPVMHPYKMEQKPLVFIEEPEAHLHPETQVKLMVVFARLVKDNKIKLVMTSHSNYIFNKASNLVIDNKINRQQFDAILFDKLPTGSVARILETDEYGIEDDNFIDTAESIYEEKMALIRKLND